MNVCPYRDWNGDDILAIANSGWTGCFVLTSEMEDSQISVWFEGIIYVCMYLRPFLAL